MLDRFFRGDDVSIKVVVTDENNEPVPIGGSIIWLTLKNDPSDSDSDAVLQKKVTSHDYPDKGISSIELTNLETDIPTDTYFYDIQIKLDSGIIKTIDYGKVKVKEDITKSTS